MNTARRDLYDSVTAVQSGCIVWNGRVNSSGYPAVTHKLLGTTVRGGHRIAWTRAYGSIPHGLYVLHSCDNRRCVNITHLRLGTQRENIVEAMGKGHMEHIRRAAAIQHDRQRANRHCPMGHLYDSFETFKSGTAVRRCSVCRAEQMRLAGRRYYRRKRMEAR